MKIEKIPLQSGHRRRKGQPQFIVLHHTHTATAADTRRVLTGKGLSTHYEIEQDGSVYEYFDPASIVTYHAGKFNGLSIGIDATHVHRAPWPEIQVKATHNLIKRLLDRFGLPVKVAPEGMRFATPEAVVASGYTVIRHNNVRNTICPDGFPLDEKRLSLKICSECGQSVEK